MALKVKEIKEKDIWENFNLNVYPHNFLQSWNWGETHRRLGKNIFRLGIFRGSKLTMIAQIIEEEAKRGRHWLIPGGPVKVNRQSQENLKTLIRYSKIKAESRKVVFMRARPNIADTQENQKLFNKLGFIKAPMHLHAETTLQLDISVPEAVLLKQMRKNTRYGIRKSQRMGVVTDVSQDKRLVDILFKLQMEVVKRKKFVPFSKEFFLSHFVSFLEDDQIAFIRAIYQGETLAIGMFVFYGDVAFYHYSGSSLKQPHTFASYAMIWRAIQEARKRGCRLFDFWGIAPTKSQRHRFAGVTLFKKGFGGRRVDYLKAVDLPFSFKYWPAYIFENIRKKVRHL